LRLVEKAVAEASRDGGKVIWIMESTMGWARVKELIGSRVRFILANVLQMPPPPKAYRHKSDKIDTGRMQREFLNGSLPQSYQPAIWWREVRRLVVSRQDLVDRQTAVKNWITHFLHHETWTDREGLWTQKGRTRLRGLKLSASDRMVLDIKLQELEQIKEFPRFMACPLSGNCQANLPSHGRKDSLNVVIVAPLCIYVKAFYRFF
jgi:hypothetical protein